MYRLIWRRSWWTTLVRDGAFEGGTSFIPPCTLLLTYVHRVHAGTVRFRGVAKQARSAHEMRHKREGAPKSKKIIIGLSQS